MNRSFVQRTLYGAATARLSVTPAARVEIDREELIDFAKQLVRIPSFTCPGSTGLQAHAPSFI